MRASNHTPGPWRLGDAGVTVFGPPNGSPSPKTIASLSRGRLLATMDGETRANARLIAAAPELLDALHSLLDYAEECASTNDERPVCIAQARAVLTKAVQS